MVWLKCLCLAVVLATLLISCSAAGHSVSEEETGDEFDDYGLEASDHNHDHEDEDCAITGADVVDVLGQLPEDLSIAGMNVRACSQDNSSSFCSEVMAVVTQLLVKLNVSNECCFDNETHCHHHHNHDSTVSTAEVYGYGFLMILVVSACSLIGVLVLPFLQKNSKFAHLYKYIYPLMIALGASALFCDALLHLIPEAFGVHGHHAGDHSHSEEEEEEHQSFIIKGIVVIGGTYVFFLFETLLHTWVHHDHSKVVGSKAEVAIDKPKPDNNQPLVSESQVVVKYGGTSDTESLMSGEGSVRFENSTKLLPRANCCTRAWLYLFKIKPLAWLIIFGDAIHNFADGLALGAAISQSLSLGVSTMIALVFHEIPHELGDYVILLSTGMRWYTALVFNLISQVTGFMGFFIGVAISSYSQNANGWILAVAAGVFLYISLVDLLPGLVQSDEKKCARFGQFIVINIGFFIAFAGLLLLAIYEEELDALIQI